MRLSIGHQWSPWSYLPPFYRYYRFSAEKSDRTLIPPEFRGCSLWTKIAAVVAPRSEDPKLIIRAINFALTQRTRSRYINVTDRQSDRQSDDLR